MPCPVHVDWQRIEPEYANIPGAVGGEPPPFGGGILRPRLPYARLCREIFILSILLSKNAFIYRT